MPTVSLSDKDWAQVMAILSTAPWRDANPLLMEIGRQLQSQVQNQVKPPPGADIRLDGNGKEVRHE